MAKPLPPRIEPQDIPSGSRDKRERFKDQMFWRIRDNIEAMRRGEINDRYVAFEALATAHSAFLAGESHESLKDAYPVQSWRSSTVTIPAELFDLLMSGWHDWQEPGQTKTLGRCYGFERASGQGKRQMKDTQAQNDKDKKRSNAVSRVHIQIGDELPVSREEAIAKAAEELGVSEKTIERAYERFGASTFAKIDVQKRRR